MKQPTAKKLFIKAFLILALAPLFTSASDAVPTSLFTNLEPLELILQMDMQKVLNDKSEDPEYSPAFLIQVLGDNDIQAFNIKIKARGRTRRITDVCEFPPLKINFVKKSTKNTVFEGQDKINMVTHCQESEDYQNYALLEYLAYKTYNNITDFSYRVRLVNVTYKDIRQNYPDIKKTGFLVEDDELLAERIGGAVSDKRIWSPDSCDQKIVDIFSLFQFMIGNTDWWIHTRHNVDLVKIQDCEQLIPIPFDFDYSGMINTPYAIPSAQLPIIHVKDRFLKGSCYNASHFTEVIKLYNSKKQAVLSTMENADFLDKKYKKKSLKYIVEFYEIINDLESFSRYINQSCAFAKNRAGIVPVTK